MARRCAYAGVSNREAARTWIHVLARRSLRPACAARAAGGADADVPAPDVIGGEEHEGQLEVSDHPVESVGAGMRASEH